MNELQAAFGVVQLRHVDEAIRKRLACDAYYRERLAGMNGVFIPTVPDGVTPNGAYFPIFIDDQVFGMSRDDLYQRLWDQGIYARRYFYPLISDFSMYRNLPSADPTRLPTAVKAGEQVICLPVFEGLESGEIDKIVGIIQRQ